MKKILVVGIILFCAITWGISADWLTPYMIDSDAAPGAGAITVQSDAYVSVSPDGKSLYFQSNRSGGLGGYDIWVSTCDGSGRWCAPTNLPAPVNTASNDQVGMSIVADGTQLFMGSARIDLTGNHDTYDLYVAVRSTANDSWSTASVAWLGAPMSYFAMTGSMAGWGEEGPFISADGNTLYYTLANGAETTCTNSVYSTAAHPVYGNPYNTLGYGFQIWKSTKVGDVWQFPEFQSTTLNLNSDTTGGDGGSRLRCSWVSPDQKTMLFACNALGVQDLEMSTRPDASSDWSLPVLITELNSSLNDSSPSCDTEMDRIFFTTTRISGDNSDRRIFTAVGTLQIRLDGLPTTGITMLSGNSTTFRARGGLKNYTWSTTGSGGSIDTLAGRNVVFTALSRGTVYLTLNEPGSVTAPAAPAQSTTIAIVVTPSDLVITPSDTTIITVGKTKDFTASGGIPPYTWSLSTTGIGSITTTSTMATFTAISAGSVDLILTDSELIQKTVRIEVIPTAAPLFPNIESSLLQRKMKFE